GTNTNNTAGFQGAIYDLNRRWLVRFRFLDADLSTWLSRDVLGYNDGPNLYSYASDRPVSLRDPTGTSASPGSGQNPLHPPIETKCVLKTCVYVPDDHAS